MSSAPTGKIIEFQAVIAHQIELLFAHNLCAKLWRTEVTKNAQKANPQKKPTVTIDQHLLAEAKALEANFSRATEAGLARVIADRREQLWLAENRAALDSSNTYFERHGLPLAKYRSF